MSKDHDVATPALSSDAVRLRRGRRYRAALERLRQMQGYSTAAGVNSLVADFLALGQEAGIIFDPMGDDPCGMTDDEWQTRRLA